MNVCIIVYEYLSCYLDLSRWRPWANWKTSNYSDSCRWGCCYKYP